MPKPKTSVDPLELAAPRSIEHLAPGSWWEVDYEEGGQVKQIWAQIKVIYHLVGKTQGDRLVHLVGIDTEGDRCDLTQLRGYGIPRTLRATEGRRCGLAVPDPS